MNSTRARRTLCAPSRTRELVTARAAPRRPKIYDDDFAGEVSETEAALVERYELAGTDVFRQSA